MGGAHALRLDHLGRELSDVSLAGLKPCETSFPACGWLLGSHSEHKETGEIKDLL